MKKTLLWVDDFRNPNKLEWKKECVINNSSVVWVFNYKSFCNYISINGLPTAINFDHDLGEKKTGYDCAQWLVNYCLDNNLKLPLWAVHSSNPIGRDNINSLLNNYKKFYESSNSQ
jgi:hypothetical protein